jgi:CheY-like chemotaxis protein
MSLLASAARNHVLGMQNAVKTLVMNGNKILVVDDDPVFTKGMSNRLHREGYEVMVASDGSEAVSALRQGKPDLILLDILFDPDVGHGGGVSWDGFLIMEWLRRMGGIGDTPVVFVTASDASEYAERARKAGALGLFQKTRETLELIDLIHRVLDRRAAAAQ